MKISVLAAFFVSLILLGHPAFAAKIHRHCQAHWEIKFLKVNGDPIAHGPTRRFGHFQARGGCGKIVPNRCRERARERARACMSATWKAPNPADCSTDAITGVNSEFRRVVGDLGGAILWNACCTTPGGTSGSTTVVSVKGITSGDKRCPGSQTFQSERKIFCEAAHKRFGKACGLE
jgi:hypothetical protein